MEVKPRRRSENVLHFAKYHGAGNDFILVDGIRHPVTPSWWHQEAISKLCNRHYGVGADGLIVLLESDECDYRMKYFNSDGKEAEMCGNGLRCLALFIRDQGYPVTDSISVETKAGQVSLDILDGNRVRVSMPPISFNRKSLPMRGEGECINEELKVGDEVFKITALSPGNPHVAEGGEIPKGVEDLGEMLKLAIEREAGVGDLLKFIKGPDVPTGGIIFGLDGMRRGYKTGNGRFYVRAKANVEKRKNGNGHKITIRGARGNSAHSGLDECGISSIG